MSIPNPIEAIGNAVGGAFEGVSNVMNSVTGGIASFVGDVGEKLGLPAAFTDALEDMTKLGLTWGIGAATGGIGGLGFLGSIGELGAITDAASFLGGASDVLGGLSSFSDVFNMDSVLQKLLDPSFNFTGAITNLATDVLGKGGFTGPLLGAGGIIPSIISRPTQALQISEGGSADKLLDLAASNAKSIDTIMGEIGKIDLSTAEGQAEFQKKMFQVQMLQTGQQMISELLKSINDLNKGLVQNI